MEAEAQAPNVPRAPVSVAKQACSANVVFAVEGRELAPFISTEIRLALEARAEVQ